MASKNLNLRVAIGAMVLILGSLACGSVKVGVVTPTPDVDTKPVQDPKSDSAAMQVAEEPSKDTVTPEFEDQSPHSSNLQTITAWLGHIASLPDSSQYDDMVVFSPDGTGEVGLAGATPEIEAEIRSLRDANGPQEYAHLWGTLTCEIDDYNGCQLLVDKLQYGANYSEEDIQDQVGTLHSHTFNSGDSTVFQLVGNFPMWYSIHASQDPNLQAQIDQLRDTGAVVKVSGQLLIGIPDVNGTRIEVSNLEVIEPGTEEKSVEAPDFAVSAEWPLFVNDRYGYQIKYPMDATISLFGPQGFSMEDKPEDMTADQYMDSLLKEFTDRLCVQIDYALGWITISASPNQNRHLTPCGPTGVGAGELISKIQPVYVGDQLYQANGHEIRLHLNDGSGGILMGETLDLHHEMFMVELDDGTVIRFGSLPRQDATYDDYLMKTKETLMQILATYQSSP
jgi:hypothetical protein